ncbi:signal peptidase II [Schumannella soli]|uniref:signal peptidase II n=1 Tax=Schumannella soli TaxID=2590779 RepID=UPI002104C5C0|nr:signal peptidase II [Schumannella soli]
MPAESDDLATPRPVRGRGVAAIALIVVVAGIVYGLDQLTKALIVQNLVEGSTQQLLGDLLQLHFVRNPGAAFSLATGMTWIFSIAAVAVVGFVVWYARRIRSLLWAVVFGLVLAGALGNLTDRLFREPGFARGHVVDFIQVWGFPAIFNIADVGITVGMALFVLLVLRGVGLDGSRRVTESSVDATTATAPDTAPDDGATRP